MARVHDDLFSSLRPVSIAAHEAFTGYTECPEAKEVHLIDPEAEARAQRRMDLYEFVSKPNAPQRSLGRVQKYAFLETAELVAEDASMFALAALVLNFRDGSSASRRALYTWRDCERKLFAMRLRVFVPNVRVRLFREWFPQMTCVEWSVSKVQELMENEFVDKPYRKAALRWVGDRARVQWIELSGTVPEAQHIAFQEYLKTARHNKTVDLPPDDATTETTWAHPGRMGFHVRNEENGNIAYFGPLWLLDEFLLYKFNQIILDARVRCACVCDVRARTVPPLPVSGANPPAQGVDRVLQSFAQRQDEIQRDLCKDCTLYRLRDVRAMHFARAFYHYAAAQQQGPYDPPPFHQIVRLGGFPASAPGSVPDMEDTPPCIRHMNAKAPVERTEEEIGFLMGYNAVFIRSTPVPHVTLEQDEDRWRAEMHVAWRVSRRQFVQAETFLYGVPRDEPSAEWTCSAIARCGLCPVKNSSDELVDVTFERRCNESMRKAAMKQYISRGLKTSQSASMPVWRDRTQTPADIALNGHFLRWFAEHALVHHDDGDHGRTTGDHGRTTTSVTRNTMRSTSSGERNAYRSGIDRLRGVSVSQFKRGRSAAARRGREEIDDDEQHVGGDGQSRLSKRRR
jgi:hypothetical protein